jgi:hypothetical protein
MEVVKCAKCGEEKPSTDFAKCTAKKNGLQSYCRVCATQARYKSPKYENTLEQERAIQMKYRYGLTKETFDSFWQTQNGKCGICTKALTKELRGYAVDHNHETGNVRGLLCNPCNTALGLFKDSPTVMQNAYQYLINKGHYGSDIAGSP